MKDNYDNLNNTFNTELEVQQVNEGGCVRRKDAMIDITDDVDKDYKYTRGQLYSLIEKGQYFQCWTERADILRHLDMVDAVISWDDSDDSACGAIAKCLEISDSVIFCNGGDRGKENTPEVLGYGKEARVEFHYGVGGTDKLNSSSWILHNYFNRQRKLLGI